MIYIKKENEIELMRKGGKVLGLILKQLEKEAVSGVTARQLDKISRDLCKEHGVTPAFLNYKPAGAPRPFPASLCVSINDQIVHGIPTDSVLRDGDMVSLDMGIIYKKFILDSATTIVVGGLDKTDVTAHTLLSACQIALEAGIAVCKLGVTTGDIGHAIEQAMKGSSKGYVFEFAEHLGGHGVGYKVHEDPYIPNYGKAGQGPKLKAGMVIAIEPILNEGKGTISVDTDGFTYKTTDGKRSCHFEHTVVITETGAEILTA